MLKTVRLVEELSGEHLVHIQGHNGIREKNHVKKDLNIKIQIQDLLKQHQQLQTENKEIKSELDVLKQEITELKTLLKMQMEENVEEEYKF